MTLIAEDPPADVAIEFPHGSLWVLVADCVRGDVSVHTSERDAIDALRATFPNGLAGWSDESVRLYAENESCIVLREVAAPAPF